MSRYPITQSALIWLCAIFEDRFGYAFTLEQTSAGLYLKLANSSQGVVWFPHQLDAFTKANSDMPHTKWDAEAEGWQAVLSQPLPMPGCSGQKCAIQSPLIVLGNNQAEIRYDIPGLTYWMLNRIEEIGRTDLDKHGRFPATSSHAHHHGYLERPVVDEWLYVLGQVIQRVWPQLELKRHSFCMKVSHDVDSPSLYAFKPWKTILRMTAGHLLKRRDFNGALQAPWLKLTGSTEIPRQDPYNTFDWIMEQSEANNLVSAFYFIAGGNHVNDADYQLNDPRIRQLMRKIHRRGHEIGLHPSYATYQNSAAIQQQANYLRLACQEEGITQSKFGGRMHYLRWEHPVTMQAWEAAGMAYDTTLSYADRPGFRCGTCHEYQGFNPLTQQLLRLRIRPLVAMECSVIDGAYLGLGYTPEALDKFLLLKERCRKAEGWFTLLWHNSYFVNKEGFQFYKAIVEAPRIDHEIN